MERSVLLFSSYKKEIYAFISGVITLMAAIALFSHNPFDSSWFFISSSSRPIANWCGKFGAQLSATLFFLFGMAAYLVVALFGSFIYWLASGGSWKYQWERVVAGVGVIMSVSILCSLHKINFITGVFYGGYIGFYISMGLYSLFDQIGSMLIAYTVLHASLVILFRFSFISIAQEIARILRASYSLVQKYRVFYKVRQALYIPISLSFRGLSYLNKLFFELIDGTTVKEAQLLETDEHKQIEYFPLRKHHYQEKAIEPATQPKSNSREPLATKIVQLTSIESNEGNNEYKDEKEDSFSTKSFGLPSRDIFIGIPENKEDQNYKRELEERARTLEEKLERFGVYGNVVSIKNGPVVTLFEYQPGIDTKLSKILALEDDLSLALRAHSIRILAPIPGRPVVGFEVSNTDRKDVLFSEVVQSEEYEQFAGSLPLVIGQDTVGNNVVSDLAKMPHLLIAGSTGSGKSVSLNAMLVSLLCKRTPDEMKLILIDPKRLEFSFYADIPHLLFPIITEPKKSIPVLKWLVGEMDNRYERMATYGARNIFDYNIAIGNNSDELIPNIVVVIDELSDLMLTVGREIEDLITRITQMARAAGIHMIVATQRPSVDVITGLIKVNFPSRISFRVTSKVDSRTILDCGGADKLLGRGDMLFLDSTVSILKRIHGAYVSDGQIEMVTNHIRSQRPVEYLDISQSNSDDLGSDVSQEDEGLLQDIISFLGEVEEVSISLLQRQFRIGYNRSARFIALLENRGYIMPADGGKARRVIR